MIVVTGASGFIGSCLVETLRSRGHHVVGIDRLAPSCPGDHLVAELSAPRAAVLDALAEADAVVHLAGKPGVRDRSSDIEQQRRRDNVFAARAVLAATPPATPLVVASSSSVYGGSRHGRASCENDALAPIGGYALSKRRTEHWCRRRLRAGGHVTVVRPFTVVGPGQRDDMALARWTDDAMAGRRLQVYGSLDRRRDFTDVRFVVDVLVRLLDVAPTTVNIGSGRSRPLADLIGAIACVVGEPDVRLAAVPVAEPDETLADTRLLGTIVGDIPTTDLRAIVAEHVARRRQAVEPLIA